MSARTDPFPLASLLACAQRELAMRKAVYKGRVAAGRMTMEAAEFEIDAMLQIAALLEAYPLTNFAEAAVRLVFADLRQRQGFAELLARVDDLAALQVAITEKVQRAVVGPVAPFGVPQSPKTLELDFA